MTTFTTEDRIAVQEERIAELEQIISSMSLKLCIVWKMLDGEELDPPLMEYYDSLHEKLQQKLTTKIKPRLSDGDIESIKQAIEALELLQKERSGCLDDGSAIVKWIGLAKCASAIPTLERVLADERNT